MLPRIQRIPALDGLRGIAAFLVVIHHAALINATYFDWEMATALGKLTPSSLVFLPLGLGVEAVFLFFVLSGYVLRKAYTEQSAATMSYFGSRMIRLYIPIWGALAIGLAVHLLILFRGGIEGTPWLTSHAFDLNARDLVRDFVIVDGTTAVNSSAWSMQYEIIFSLLLPVVLVVTSWAGARWIFMTVAALGVFLLMFAATDVLTTYLGMFIAGALLAEVRIPRLRGTVAVVLAVIALLFFTTRRTIPIWTEQAFGWENWQWFASVTIASMIFIALAVGNTTTDRMLSSRIPQYVGLRSYSLYLVQAPVIVGTTILLTWGLGTSDVQSWWSFVVIAASLVVGVVFFRAVELPSHKLARKLRQRLAKEKPASTLPADLQA